jgi:hypothetical protein
MHDLAAPSHRCFCGSLQIRAVLLPSNYKPSRVYVILVEWSQFTFQWRIEHR